MIYHMSLGGLMLSLRETMVLVMALAGVNSPRVNVGINPNGKSMSDAHIQ